MLRRESLRVKLAVGGLLSGFTLYMGSPLRNLIAVLNGSPSFAFGRFSDVAVSYGNFVIRYKIDVETAQALVDDLQKYFLDLSSAHELHSLLLQYKLVLVQSLCQKGAASANDLVLSLKLQAAQSSNNIIVNKEGVSCLETVYNSICVAGQYMYDHPVIAGVATACGIIAIVFIGFGGPGAATATISTATTTAVSTAVAGETVTVATAAATAVAGRAVANAIAANAAADAAEAAPTPLIPG